jgi:hypothetical protein
MIVPSMTVKEIHDEIFRDLKDLGDKVEDCKKNFERVVLKSSRYPVVKSYKCQTVRKNILIITFTARKRSERRKPILGFYGIYSRIEGRYAVALTIGPEKIISVYPPHFFKRYRERILKDDSISNEEVINTYFKNSWGFTATVVNEQYESVYQSIEDTDVNDKVSFVAATSDGYCFGEKQGSINVIKTVISEEMLFENQKQIFSDLKKYFNEIKKEMYE